MADQIATGGRPYTKPVRWKRWLWGVLAFIGLVVVLFGIWAYRVGNALTGHGIKSIGELYKIKTDPRQFFPGKRRVTVLVLGKDYNRDRRGMPYTKGSRSDTMMLLSVDLDNAKINAVSIPRDSKVTAADGVTDKINSVIVRGGPRLVEDTMNSLFGVRPDYYVVLKPDAVRSIVDALGGVDVTAIDDMNYDDSWGQLHIHIPKGPNHLDGAGAEGFVRFRKTTGKRTHKGINIEEGDLRRAARQQQLIHAMIQSAKSPNNVLHLPSIIDTGFKQLETDMSQSQLLALGSYFQQQGGAQINGGSLPGEDSNGGVYYYILDMNRSTKMMQWLINGDDAAGQSLPRVAVYNSSNYSSAARSIASTLYADSFDAFSGGGRAPLAETTEVKYRMALYQPQADAIARQLGVGPPTKDDSRPADTWSPEIYVIVGNDLAKTFAANSPTATTSTRSSRRGRHSHSSTTTHESPPAPDVDVTSQNAGN